MRASSPAPTTVVVADRVESQGGGTILLTRGDIALKLGLPVAGVIGFVHSYADGAHTSIPAPGLVALAAAWAARIPSWCAILARLGITPDDIAVVSKHDTSTNANDPNESELHNTLAHAIGRTDGNPLFVISQKTLNGQRQGRCLYLPRQRFDPAVQVRCDLGHRRP